MESITIDGVKLRIPSVDITPPNTTKSQTNEEVWEQIEKEYAYSRKPIKRK